MKKYLLCSVLFLMACGGRGQNIPQSIVYDPDDKDYNFAPWEVFASMRVIQLQELDDILIDTESDLIFDEDNFYIVDASRRKRVDAFDMDGRYMGSVASAGRAGNEYIGIDNVQVVDGAVAIYSYHNKAVHYYNIDGSFIKKDILDYNPLSLLKDKDGYWGFSGYTGKMVERVVKMDADGKIVGKYLPSEMPIIPLEENSSVLTGYKDGVLVRESLRNVIFNINENGQEEIFLKFDFGKYNVPEKYFNNSDPYAAAEKLMASDYVIMNRFLVNNDHMILSVDFQLASREGLVISSLGVESGGKWRWLKTEKEGPLSMFFSAVRQLTPDSDLVLLTDGNRIKEFVAKYPELNVEFDNSITDNPCIVLCHIK